jgi:hypothetical protein
MGKRSHRAVIVVGTLIVAAACSKKDGPPADYQTPAAPAAPVPGPPAMQVARADFGKLGWLEGSWRGQLPTGGFFYETYQRVNDTTITQASYKDSTFAAMADSPSTIGYRNGVIFSEGGSTPWHATKLDTNMVEFQMSTDATRRFTWTRDSKDQWTARLYSSPSGQEKVTTYLMKRVRR